MEFLFSTKLQVVGMQLFQKYTPLQVFAKIWLRFVAIYNEFLTIYRFLFPRTLAVVNGCKVLKIFASKVQYIFRAIENLRCLMF